MMKKFLSLLLVSVMLISVVGCSGSAESAADVSDIADTPEEEALKIAIMVPGSPLDGGWCQFGAEGARYAAEQLGAEVTVIEVTSASVMKTEAEALCDDGYQIIIGHGGEYALPFSEVSKEYPDSSFISIGGQIVTDNQFSLQIATEVAAYVQGVEAALLSKSGIVGTTNAIEEPSFMKTSVAFELGAKSINPDITVIYSVMTNWFDTNEAYEIAMSHIAQGADFINNNADMTAYGAAKAAKEKGVLFSGYGIHYEEYPDTILSAIQNELGPAYLTAINEILSGEKITEPLVAGTNEGAVSLLYNPEIFKDMPDSVKEAYDKVVEQVNSGELYIPGEDELFAQGYTE